MTDVSAGDGIALRLSDECACNTIWSPQMEYTPGPHHDRGQCPLWRPPADH